MILITYGTQNETSMNICVRIRYLQHFRRHCALQNYLPYIIHWLQFTRSPLTEASGILFTTYSYHMSHETSQYLHHHQN
jgi:hypothetical protein